jgi:putative ABC transport system ATP-binding protein
MALLEQIHEQGNTIILVTHEEEIARHAHRIIRLKDGLIDSDTLNNDIRKIEFYQDMINSAK